MLSFNKKFLALLAVLQLLANQVMAETTSHVACTYAMSGRGLAEEITVEMDRIQENASAENKFFEFVSITIEDYYMYVLYNLSDKNGEVNPCITKVAYATGWTYTGIHESLQEEINSIQNFALSENKSINFLDIQTTTNGNAFIIYEISK